MKNNNKLYGVGVFLTLLGCAGIAEYVTSSRGSFLMSSIVFSIGYSSILVSYVVNEKKGDRE